MSKKKPIEQYDHRDKKRLNNPPVGLVTPETDPESGKRKTYRYDPHIDPALQFDSQRSQVEKIIDNGLAAETAEEAKAALAELKKRQEPYLNWAGKAERTSFEVPTVSLHVHERIDPKTIIEAVRKKNGAQQAPMFGFMDEERPLREAIEFYQHSHGWKNRLIAGDSLLVMNSLLEKEGMAGQVQMVYIDPPYGITYGSNFQPFVNKRSVQDGNDEDLTQEPEMLKAFRDTWELGLHSYLSYLRDRLLLARELLSESGSVFVQISDENAHHVRELMDEVFGHRDFVCTINYKTKKMTLGNTRLVETIGDYVLYYAKDKDKVKYHSLYQEKDWRGDIHWSYLELPDGTRRTMTAKEKQNPSLIPQGSMVFMPLDLRPSGYCPTMGEKPSPSGEDFSSITCVECCQTSGCTWFGVKNSLLPFKALAFRRG